MMFYARRSFLSCVALSVVALTPLAAPAQRVPAGRVRGTANGNFRLSAPDLTQRGRITTTHVYNGMGCTGQNISPTLTWTNAPAGTRSFAVTMYDPDAPTGSGWWHWVVYNIPNTVTTLPAGAGTNNRLLPRGVTQGNTDFGTRGYGGPCPPAGAPHHYHFKVFALRVDHIDVPNNATAAMVGFNLNANKIATAELTALYGQ